ncbi:MAG: VOC family protein [Chloroflexi bacterium]|jgi:predicted enzyme related to lactoylglutathione lyase|nr:VOC family protein [Chloroflexota bacterium]
MPRIVHFELPSKNPEKLSAFYRSVFDWQISKWEGPIEYWMVGTGPDSEPGIDGGLMTNGEFPHVPVLTVDVDNLDEYIRKVVANGGEVFVPKGPVPGVGWLAYCKDVEGTLFGMMQDDPNAGMPPSE